MLTVMHSSRLKRVLRPLCNTEDLWILMNIWGHSQCHRAWQINRVKAWIVLVCHNTSISLLDKATPVDFPLIVSEERKERGILRWAMDVENLTLFQGIRGLPPRLVISHLRQGSTEAQLTGLEIQTQLFESANDK